MSDFFSTTWPVNLGTAGVSKTRLTGLRITTQGEEFPFPIRATVRHNRWFQCGTFEVKISLYGQAKFDMAWWGSNDRVADFPIQIEYGLSDSPENGYEGLTWFPMMSGVVDKIFLDLGQGIVTAHGRDYMSRLIDSYVLDTVEGSIDDKITELIRRVGLTPNITAGDTAAPTAGLTGQQTTTVGNTFNSFTNAFDYIAAMLMRTGRIPQANGTAIDIRPNDYIAGVWPLTFTPPENTAPVVVLKDANFSKMMLERDLNLSRNLTVMVRNQDANGNASIEGLDAVNRSRLQNFGTANLGASQQYTIPGVSTQGEAENLATRIWERTMNHEKKVSWVEPGDLYLNVFHRIKLVDGQGSAATNWHSEYFLESIERTMDWRDGFVMQCVATQRDPTAHGQFAGSDTFDE